MNFVTNTRYGRSGRIRTDGIEVPNFARYQLRHTPMGENIQFFCQIRKWSNLWSKVFRRNTRRRKSEKTRGKRRFCELSAVGSRGGHTLPNLARYQLRYIPGVMVRFVSRGTEMGDTEMRGAAIKRGNGGGAEGKKGRKKHRSVTEGRSGGSHSRSVIRKPVRSWLLPEPCGAFLFSGVRYGIRTHDLQGHNLTR